MLRRLEQYVTPIILTYVDKYIKDFKPEDTQVSLWQGALSLHNVELRPDVLEEELNLPFTLSSGHIHELIIQVPWLKLNYEPIVVTINTIECVIKLKNSNTGDQGNKRRQIVAPSSYVQQYLGKIVNNINFKFQNLILKYVEEDVVVSVNIKHLSIISVGGEWQPMYTELKEGDLHIRKVMKLSNLTLCLDKRDAAGKIKSYLEPLLYRCELELRLDNTYESVYHTSPSSVRVNIASPSLEFSISYDHIPLLLRLSALFVALKEKHLKINKEHETSNESAGASKPGSPVQGATSDSEQSTQNETWAGWMWSFVQPFPLDDEEEPEEQPVYTTTTGTNILIGINFDKVKFFLKIPEYSAEVSAHTGTRKVRHASICCLQLNSLVCQTSTHENKRFCFRGGVRQVSLFPENNCACGFLDSVIIPEGDRRLKYFDTTTIQANELFWPVEYNDESAVEFMTDEEMSAICGGVAFSYVHHLVLPETDDDSIPTIPEDLEYSNFKESSNMNVVIGPFELNVTAGLIHRLTTIKMAADSYDYAPYAPPKPPLKKNELPPPTTDDYDALIEFIPKVNIRLSIVKPKVSLAVWDHFSQIKPLALSDRNNSSSVKKVLPPAHTDSGYFESLKDVPTLVFKADIIELKTTKPKYPNRLTYVTCQLPDPPAIMFEACHQLHDLKVDNFSVELIHSVEDPDGNRREPEARLFHKLTKIMFFGHMNCICFKPQEQPPLIGQCNFHFTAKILELQEYWNDNLNIVLNDYSFNMENLTFCATMPKLMLAYHVLMGVFPDNLRNDPKPVLLTTTLVKDAFGTKAMIHLELTMEGLAVRTVSLAKTQTCRLVLNKVKSFCIDPTKVEVYDIHNNKVWIFTAPDTNEQRAPFLKVVAQFSKCEAYPSFVTLKMVEGSFSLDPLLCQWLTYKYYDLPPLPKDYFRQEPSPATGKPMAKPSISRKTSQEVHGTFSRTSNKQSAGHSSSDRERDFVHGVPYTPSQNIDEHSTENVEIHSPVTTSQETVTSNILNQHLAKLIYNHRHMSIYLEMNTVKLYFPLKSVPAVDCPTLSDAIHKNVLNIRDKHCSEKVVIVSLPSMTLKSASLKENLLCYCIHGLPAKFPPGIWDSCSVSFPWNLTMTNLGCNSLASSTSYRSRLYFTTILKPVSSNITITFNCRTSAASLNDRNTILLTPQPGTSHDFGEKMPTGSDILSGDLSQHMRGDKYSTIAEPMDSGLNPPDIILEETYLATAVHVDTTSVVLALNREQVVILMALGHGLHELLTVLDVSRLSKNGEVNKNIKSDETASQRPAPVDVCEGSTSESGNFKESHADASYVDDFDSGITKGTSDNVNKETVPEVGSKKDGIVTTAWIQWTISKFMVKFYAPLYERESIGLDIKTPQDVVYKIMLEAEDIMFSLDAQSEYIKMKIKVATACMQQYKRVYPNRGWVLGEFNGFVMKGREIEHQNKPNDENSFLSVTVTRARRHSVFKRWIENMRVHINNTASEGYITEVELSLQPIDFVFGQAFFDLMVAVLSPCNTPVRCQSSTNAMNQKTMSVSNGSSILTAKFWDAQQIPLTYFEANQIRIFFPTKNMSSDQNLVMLKIDKISLNPVADNPVCRNPVRPDLYHKAARNISLHIPGSEVEDRQCQFLIKDLEIKTGSWNKLEILYGLNVTSEQAGSENPAVLWNNKRDDPISPSTQNLTPILKNTDICTVIALSIYRGTELICGPTFDVSIPTETEIYLCKPQVELLHTVTSEISSFTDRLVGGNINRVNSEDPKVDAVCPYIDYILADICSSHGEFKREPRTIYGTSDPEASSSRLQGAHMSPSDIGTATSSEMSCSRTWGSHESRPRPLNYSLSAKKTPLSDIFEGYISVRKVSLFLYDTFKGEDSNEQEEMCITNIGCVILEQPCGLYSNTFCSTKIQASLFALSMHIGDGTVHKGLPEISDYTHAVLESRAGARNPSTGLKPALFDAKWERASGRKPTILVQLNCPIKVTASMMRLIKLRKFRDEWLSHFFESNEDALETASSPPTDSTFLMDLLTDVSSVDILTNQIVLSLKLDYHDYEILISVATFNQSISFGSRLETLNNTGIFESLVVSLSTNEGAKRLLVYPWTIGFEISTPLDYRQDMSVYCILIDTDRLIIEVELEHVIILVNMFEYWQAHKDEIMGNCRDTSTPPEHAESSSSQPIDDELWHESLLHNYWTETTPSDQHYKDDLRAGAFRYVLREDGFPLPYQMFIHNDGLTWRYPQPRTITRIHSYPVPFEIRIGNASTPQKDFVHCTLEYYCEVTRRFNLYEPFDIKQSVCVRKNMSSINHDTIMASIWRVIMHPYTSTERIIKENKNNSYIFDKTKYVSKYGQNVSRMATLSPEIENQDIKIPVIPQTLAACLRIDSYHSPNLIPQLQIITNISSAEINFLNSYRERPPAPTIEGLIYQHDYSSPHPNTFLHASLISAHFEMKKWAENVSVFYLNGNVACDVVHGSNLSLTRVLKCDTLQGAVVATDKRLAPKIKIRSKILQFMVGPHHLRPLFSIFNNWKDSIPHIIQSTEEPKNNCFQCAMVKQDIVMQKYFICNNTNVTLRISQLGIEENIFIETKKYHLYTWKSNENLLQLSAAVQIGNWQLSTGFDINTPGINTIDLEKDESYPTITLIVLVEFSSPAQRRITLMGKLSIVNLMEDDIDFKIYEKIPERLQAMASPVFTIAKNDISSSMFIEVHKESKFRIRFSALAGGWTGDVPLQECESNNSPWLVKVPRGKKVMHICVWCRVILDRLLGRCIVIISPLYMLKSHLPLRKEVKLVTENRSPIEVTLHGKGRSQMLLCEGTTTTKHDLMFKHSNTAYDRQHETVSVHYGKVDNAAFYSQPTTSNPNVDTLLTELRKWMDSQQEGRTTWPYFNEDDNVKWIPAGEELTSEISVRFLPAVKGIDSLIVDLVPWALIGNSIGAPITIYNQHKHAIFELENNVIISPPSTSLANHFFLGVNFKQSPYFSQPLALSTALLGPYEPPPDGQIFLNKSTSISINCYSHLCITTMSFEIKNGINLLQLSSKYVFINQTQFDILISSMALPLASAEELTIPSSLHQITMVSTGSNHGTKLIGTPLTEFVVELPEYHEISIKYCLYICLGLSVSTMRYNCPVRIDQFIPRKCISLKNGWKSEPILLTFQEYRGQIYITAHLDEVPQLLIKNESNIPLAVAQVQHDYFLREADFLNEFPRMQYYPSVITECWKSDWKCVVEPGESIYYTMPTISEQYPNIAPMDGSVPGFIQASSHIAFAYLPPWEEPRYLWSSPLNVNIDITQQLVRVPYYMGDIKVTIVKYPHSSLVKIENVTQADISASEIRARISGEVPLKTQTKESDLRTTTSDRPIPIPGPSREVSSVARALGGVRVNRSEPDARIDQLLLSLIERENKYSKTSCPRPCQQQSQERVNTIFNKFEIIAIFDSIQVRLVTDGTDVEGAPPTGEVMFIALDYTVITTAPNCEGCSVALTVRGLQVDNPLFPNGGYDFQVVLVGKDDLNLNPNSLRSDIITDGISHLSNVVMALRLRSTLHLSFLIDTWAQDSVSHYGLSQLGIDAGTMSVYFEDTYMNAMVDYISDFMFCDPAMLCNHIDVYDEDTMYLCSVNLRRYTSVFVIIPESILAESFSAASPLRVGSLRIEALDILLSIRTSVMMYLALDHSPLQFAAFEREEICTSSYRLGHTLTMHYLAEAIFGAGWVVGSLEILGSPGGLARRVGAGLRDLVTEPCRGLLLGPWGFLVGITHGSASLLRHVTQGTVESVSMVMGSVARNLDRLSLDQEHMRRTERARRLPPVGLAQALTRGLQGLAVSLLGAVGGIAHEALMAGSQRRGAGAVARGITRGLMGAITKPLSATADLLALTGQGLLRQAGWDPHPRPRWCQSAVTTLSSRFQTSRQIMSHNFQTESFIYICEGYDRDTSRPISLVITNRWLMILNIDRSSIREVMEIGWCKVARFDSDTGDFIISVTRPEESAADNDIQMDALSRARVAAYVGVEERANTREHLICLILPTQCTSHTADILNLLRNNSLEHGFTLF